PVRERGARGGAAGTMGRQHPLPLGRAGRGGALMAGRLAQLSLFAVALVIGLLLVGQLRSQARPLELSSLSAQELSALIQTLSARNVDLSDGLADLREQIRDYELAEVQGQSRIDLTREDLAGITAFGGLRAVEGQGLLIR